MVSRLTSVSAEPASAVMTDDDILKVLRRGVRRCRRAVEDRAPTMQMRDARRMVPKFAAVPDNFRFWAQNRKLPEVELELELIQSHMAQKPVLRGEAKKPEIAGSCTFSVLGETSN